MKKIKGLLLFGILTLLGIGSSFGASISNVSYELGGYNRNYQFYVGNASSQGGISYISGVLNNTPVFIELISKPYSLYSGDLLFDVLGTHTGKWSSVAYSPSFNLYYGNDFVSLFGKYSSSYGSIFNFNNSLNRSRSLYVNQNFGLRLFLSNNSSSIQCLFPDISNSLTSGFYGGCDIENYQIFPYNLGYSINSISNSVYDSTYNSGTSILNSRKASVFPGLGQGYSFIYEKVSSDGGFRSVFSGTLTSDDFSSFNNGYYVQNKYIDGQLIFNVNNITNGGNQGQTTIIAIDSLNNLYYRYSLYNCSDTIISNCTFVQGGKLYSGSELIVPSFNSDFDYFYSGLNYIDTGGYYYIPTIYTYYDSISNTLTLTRYGYLYRSSSNSPLINFSKTINLVSGEGLYNYNLLEYLGIQGGDNSGNGNQSLYSGNVSLSTCIDTQICWDYTGSQGDIVRMCTTQCVSSGVIASGGYIGSDGTYYFVNSPISIEDSLKTDNPENMFTGSYIESGGILSLSYFTDYFQPGAKKIGVCPFKYYEGPLDFLTKLKIGDVYLLMPVLCFYSAFQQGKNVSFFDQYDVNDGLFSQPLLYGESDNHKLLFAFFDVLFSIGLLGLIRYLSRHLF